MTIGSRIAAVASVLALSLATACGGGGGDVGEVGEIDPDATLRAGWTVGATTLDPHAQSSEIVGFRFGLSSIYDRLFTVTAAGQVEGQLVTDFGYSPDGSTLELTLREGVTFRDGTPLDAAVVKKNLDRAMTKDSPVVKSRMSTVGAVEVTSPYSLSLKLESNTRAVPYVLADMAGYIMNPVLFETGNPATATDGSGAYKVDTFVPGEKLVLTKDRIDYWDPEAAKIAHIEHSQIADFQAFSNALSGGQIDIGQFQPNQVAALEGKRGLNEVTIAHGVGYDIYFNRNVAPMDNPKVREAVNFAIDRKAIVDALYPGSEPKYQFYREGLPGYDPDLQGVYGYDPDRARELLAEAGLTAGVDMGEVIVSASVVPGVADVIQQQLQAVGIEFEPVTVDSLQVFPTWAGGANAAMVNSSNSGSSPLAGAQENWISATRNPAGTTPEFDALFAAASDNGLSDADADLASQKLNAYLVEQAWRAPFVWIDFKWILSDKVQGFGPDMDFATTTGPYDWRYLWMTT